MHVQRYYYHRLFLTKLFKTDSKPMLNSVDIFPLAFILLIFVFIVWIEIFKKEGKREGRESLTWVSVIGPTMSLGKKDEWRGNQTKTQPYVISKSKLFLKTYRCSKSPGGDKKKVIADTLTAPHTQRGLCWTNQCPHHHQQSYYNPIYEMQNFISQYR